VPDGAQASCVTTLAYPYASGLVVPIVSADEMSVYLNRYNPTHDSNCPFGWPVNGVTILPRPLT
jgi:hypothetical protein